jgi:hypothetical protein
MTALPEPVAAVCSTFLGAVPDDLVTGLYLRGGLAFGEWVEGHSDVDFTATLRRRPTPADVAALRAAHQEVAAAHGGSPYLDGTHVLVEDLMRAPEECPDAPNVHLGTFSDAGRFDLSPVSWHELARHGVAVRGPALDTLGIWTDDDVLRDFTLTNLDTYWRGQAAQCRANPAGASVPYACEWVVPGVARLDHLLVTGEQTAKSRAARWGLTFYPEEFHRVLRESLAIREGAFEPQYDDLLERARDVAAFVTYVVDQCDPATPSSPTGTSASTRFPSGASGQAQAGS